jgi:hypothetical protein
MRRNAQPAAARAVRGTSRPGQHAAVSALACALHATLVDDDSAACDSLRAARQAVRVERAAATSLRSPQPSKAPFCAMSALRLCAAPRAALAPVPARRAAPHAALATANAHGARARAAGAGVLAGAGTARRCAGAAARLAGAAAPLTYPFAHSQACCCCAPCRPRAPWTLFLLMPPPWRACSAVTTTCAPGAAPEVRPPAGCAHARQARRVPACARLTRAHARMHACTQCARTARPRRQRAPPRLTSLRSSRRRPSDRRSAADKPAARSCACPCTVRVILTCCFALHAHCSAPAWRLARDARSERAATLGPTPAAAALLRSRRAAAPLATAPAPPAAAASPAPGAPSPASPQPLPGECG